MFEEAKEEIQKSSKESSVYIGSDSRIFKKNGQKFAKYTTVVIIHKDSKHGCKIFYESETLPEYGNLKQRLLSEVSYAVAAATEIIEVIETRQMSVHLDLNPSPSHKSNIAVKEALGWVKGAVGLDAVIKPNGWAASHCADWAVRK